MIPVRLAAWRALRHHRGLACGAALGVVVSTAVIVGALLLGDSLSVTLQQRFAARLGPVARAVLPPRPLSLALSAASGGAGLRHLAGSAIAEDGAAVPVRVLGVDAAGRALWPDLPPLSPRAAAISPALAEDFGLRPGDGLVLAVEAATRLPAGSAFAERRHERLQRRLRVEVAAVLPAAGVGGFSLDPGLAPPRSVWLDRVWLAGALGEDRIDALVGGTGLTLGQPTLADLGLRLVVEPEAGQVTVQGDGLVLSPTLLAAGRETAERSGGSAAAVAVHLADRIVRAGGGEASYVLIAAAEGEGPDEDGIDLAAWLAADLGAAPGDRLTISVPLAAGRFATVPLTVRHVVADAVAVQAATRVPVVPGLTDAERIERWDLPYPIESARINERDDAWWAAHRTAPRAFVAAALLRRLWHEGPLGAAGPWASGLRVRPPAGEPAEAFAVRLDAALRLAVGPEASGLAVRDLRAETAQRARGNADLAGLFLGLGSVVILAGLALATAVVRFQVGRRAAEVGVLLACGWDVGAVRRLLWYEALGIAATGAVLGGLLGVGWAWLLIALLRTAWGGAAVGVPLSLHVAPGPLLAGMLAGLLAGALAAAWGLRALSQRAPLALLAGWRAVATAHRRRRLPLFLAEPLRFPGRSLLTAGLMAAAGLILVLVAAQRQGAVAEGRDGPCGGYALRLTCALPLPEDLATPAGRSRLGFTAADEAVLAGAEVAAFLLGPGEDVSCRNPARPVQPRVLGCLAPGSGFGLPDAAWAALRQDADPIPVLGDAESLRWTLGISGPGETPLTLGGNERRVRVAGAFPGSVFAGELLMGEAAFRRCFPAVAAPQRFLISLPPERAATAAALLRRRLAGLGAEVETTAALVAAQHAVRDAYLSLFLALGGLGLLIGAGGLAVLLARGALERRAELAVLAALGRRPGLLLFTGQAVALAVGLAVGLAAAALLSVFLPPAGGWGGAWPALALVAGTGLASAALAARWSTGSGLVQELRRD